MPSTLWWIGNGQITAQVNSIVVGGTIANGQVYTVTINGKTVTYTANVGADTNTTVTSSLLANLQASKIPEFKEVAWTAGAALTIVGTMKTAGEPFVQTSSATGTGTLVTTTTTANSSPSDWTNTANWSTGAVPITGDTVYIGNSDVPILWNIDQNAVTLAALYIQNTFTGGSAQIGLPEFNGTGVNQYREYRETYLKIGATICTIGDGPGNGCNLIKLNFGSVQTTCTVYGTGRATIEEAALELIGTNASNVLYVFGGSSVAVAQIVDKTTVPVVSTFATLLQAANQGSAPTVHCGPGATLTTVTVQAGALTIESAATTVTVKGGTLGIEGTGAYTTITVENPGAVTYSSSGTITTLNAAGSIDFSGNQIAKTVTNCTVYGGGKVLDPGKTVTWTNGLVLSGCRIKDVTLDLGYGRTITPS